MKTRTFSLCHLNKFDKFGDQVVTQFVLFESKYLFSIIFFYFHKTTSSQDRFHTHAFNALSIKLFGQYDEHILLTEDFLNYRVDPRTKIFKYFPRNSYHRIANSNGCATILITGPWKKDWKEWLDGKITYYNWGRN